MFEKYDAYKDSGVEWIGDIPVHWDVKNLRYAFDFLNHRRIPLSALERGNKQGRYPYYGASGIIDYVDAYLFDEKLLLIAEDGANLLSKSTPLAFLAEGKYWVNNHAHILKPKTEAYGFWEKLLCSVDYTVFITGAAQPKLSRENLGGIRLPIPPINEQLKIEKFIDQKTSEIDQAIAIKEQQIALLNERKQIVIQKAVTQGLDPNVAMKDSGVEWIGEIPEHWKIKKLKFICKSQGRIGFKGYSSDDLVEANEGALTLGATHLNWNGEIILDQPVYLNWKKYYESPEIMVKKDDILIVQRGSTCGKVAIVDKDYGEVTINPSLVLLKEFRENPYFCVESIKVVLNGILNEVSKTAIPMISQFQINNIQIALPPLEEQVFIVKKVQEVTAQYSEINKFILDEIIRLKEYKTTLINDAVTGKIKVA